MFFTQNLRFGFCMFLSCFNTDETLAARVFNPGGSDGQMPSKGWERDAMASNDQDVRDVL
jgi:hypothetical protein